MRTTFRTTLTVAAAAAMVLGSTGLAAADDEDSNPAVNRNECALAGGEFTQDGRGNNMVRTCVVGAGEDTYQYNVPASHPQQEWVVDVLIPGGATVYTFQPSVGFAETTTGTGGVPTVIACRNHQGKAIVDFAENSNCQPAQ